MEVLRTPALAKSFYPALTPLPDPGSRSLPAPLPRFETVFFFFGAFLSINPLPTVL